MKLNLKINNAITSLVLIVLLNLYILKQLISPSSGEFDFIGIAMIFLVILLLFLTFYIGAIVEFGKREVENPSKRKRELIYIALSSAIFI